MAARAPSNTTKNESPSVLRSWPPFCEHLIARRPDGFLLRMDVPLKSPGIHATISHVLTQVGEETVEVTVDNNVYVPTYEGDISDVWEKLDELRVIKNELFFGALTDDALEPYR